jgi:uncharacterized alpha-E superfamily protein
VLRACRRHGLLRHAYADEAGALQSIESDLIGGMFDLGETSSLAFNVRQLALAAGNVRDCLSSDSWRLVNRMSRAFACDDGNEIGFSDALERIDCTIVSLVALGGVETSYMSRDDGWRLLSIGRAIERLVFLCSVVAEVAAGGDTAEPALLDWLLDLTAGTIAYRARYQRAAEWLTVADLLVFDRRSPRSVVYQLGKLVKQVRLLPPADLGAVGAELTRAFARGRAGMTASGEPAGTGAQSLCDFLRACEGLAIRLSDALSRAYFSHILAAGVGPA